MPHEELARRDYLFGETIEQSPIRNSLKQMLQKRREELEKFLSDDTLKLTPY